MLAHAGASHHHQEVTGLPVLTIGAVQVEEVRLIARLLMLLEDEDQIARVERLSDASHWVHHDQHERVNQLLTDFFSPALKAKA